ncbi:SDR family NAD(P)-dependent oxidoreductase [Dyadobacter fanqingshengii]|uniref:SDR family NAD(P)-dependent oxidoreductase n=1 Tax=Dyadobacter fanqingshengii TaxID=2906443 RepID=UPI002078E92A|nr:SDR family NAD(P)-dependent oxidoreductase [Dyadobacter fanqingshengii]USJ37891.1 SDR family NAD(P)-dependent oxidoreductase [Dyadobacter fanqingshengii]
MLASGDNVVATVRSKPQELAETLGNDGNLHVAILDVTSEEQAKAAVEQAVHQFGSIDVLVNNAGYGLLVGVEEATDAEARKVFDTNVFGTLFTHLRRAAPDA